MIFDKYIQPFLIWRIKNIKERPFILILSAIVGFASGLGAVVIKNSVHFIKKLLTSGFAAEYHNYLYFLFPVLGIFLAALFIHLIIKHHVGHGIPSVLFSISKKNGMMKSHNMFSSVVTSALTVGFGGSVGLEGPTVATGAAIGSNISKTLRLNYRTTILLLGCAAAGAMSSIFKAPIAAIVFAIEVIMLDLTLSSLVPLLIASISAVVTSYFFLGSAVMFEFEIVRSFFLKDIPLYIALGVFTGLLAVYFTRVYMFINKRFDLVKNRYIKVLIGGSILGILIFLFPPLYGEGYETINSLLSGNYSGVLETSMFFRFKDNIYAVLAFLLFLILLKVIATSVTFGSGGVGGIFAPTLFIGSTMGFLFASTISLLGIYKHVPLSNLTLAGMGGAIAGVLHAPLTAIFLIAEITHGYGLFIPLMITSAISYTTVRTFQKHSVYTIQLAKRGQLITHHKDKAILSLLKTEKVLEKNFITLHPDHTIRDLVKAIRTSKRNIFPVVDKNNNFLGLVPLDNVRNIIFDNEKYDKVFVQSVMIQPPSSVSPEESMESVMNKFRETGLWNLPVLQHGKYLGFISRANIFNAYRSMLLEFSED
jgi:chloride channel protein, CIC family